MVAINTVPASVILSGDDENARLRAEIEALKASNVALQGKARKAAPFTLKVGAKGGVSIYGFTVQFPVTLYGNQMVSLLEHLVEICQFMIDNNGKLASKGTTPAEALADRTSLVGRCQALIKRFGVREGKAE